MGRQVRKAFVAEDAPDWLLFSADYSQIELRVLAHLSQDEGLLQAFRRGEDRVTVDELPEDVWRRVIDIKVTGTFLMSKAVASVLIEQGQGGRIINLSSTVGKQASAQAPAYSTANFAVQGFAQVPARTERIKETPRCSTS